MQLKYVKPGLMYRHNGFIKSSKLEVWLIEPDLPGNPDKALVAVIGTLTTAIRDQLIGIIEKEGNSVDKLSALLARRKFSSMTVDCLNTLHRQGFLVPVSKADLVMTPNMQQAIPYLELVALVAEQLGTQTVQEPTPVDPTEQAHALLVEANRLVEEAKLKRQAAYRLAPELEPVEITAPLPRIAVAAEVETAELSKPVAKKATAKKTSTPKVAKKPAGRPKKTAE